jgi:hypothetical protein
MKFLVSQMAVLKLRLLESVVQPKDIPNAGDALVSQRIETNKMIVCKAVEDRICRRIDLASRTDLTDRQVMDALRLLLKIARKSDWPIDFSSSEIFLLTHAPSRRSRERTSDQREPAMIRF